MELINQHTKKIMEECKERAYDAGLRFEKETLEYIVSNRDLLELMPKGMIPTLYDYWVHDVEILQGKGKYELYPGNPYETVINTRPAISFYNDNNPDWLNVMIFYHVIAHIDFFQNNLFFKHTWDYDFTGSALSDKRLIAKLRSEKGKWVDYIIEFARGIDNLAGYYSELYRTNNQLKEDRSKILDFYFDVFLQSVKKIKISDYIKEIERFNQYKKEHGKHGEKTFFKDVAKKHPEFEAVFEKSKKEKKNSKADILQFIIDNSEFLNKEKNEWMKSVIEIVRKTSIFFQPQIRTKIMNEGWASYWHDKLFLQDDRIHGHEVDYARVNAWVTSLPRVGLNPYALGMRLFQYIEEMADKGKLSYDFEKTYDVNERKKYDSKTGKGKEFIFNLRDNLNDFMFINNYIDQDFVERHKLFVAGKKFNNDRMVWQYYVKSRKAEDYRKMMTDVLYHPPFIDCRTEGSNNNSNNGDLLLVHNFEGKPLVKDFISNTMIGIEYLWGAPVHLETSEVEPTPPPQQAAAQSWPYAKAPEEPEKKEIKWKRVLYTMKGRELSKKNL